MTTIYGTTLRACALGALLLATVPPSAAAIIGHMTPAEPLTETRVANLPQPAQAPWLAYLARSRAAMANDKASLAAERGDKPAPPSPSQARPGTGMPLNRDAAWYGTAPALRAADNIVSFQTPAGGWGKNVDRSGPVRERGQSYVLVEGDWEYVGTIDNDATTTEMRFLARVQARAPGEAGKPYRESFLKGVRYLLASQYPNGGMPQVYPVEGGYHDAVTLNDDAMLNAVELLGMVAARQGDYAFVPPAVADSARAAVERAIGLFLATQIKAGGILTGWGQQYDPLTLAPSGARNFEPASLSTGESAKLLVYLMNLREPSPEVVRAVHAGAAWLKRAALRDVEWGPGPGDAGRMLVSKPGAGPIWARYYDIATMKPVFGDRDRSIHDDVNGISKERRNGYAWFGTGPAKTLERYEAWAGAHPR